MKRLLAAILLLSPGAAYADIASCVQIADPTQRLACYDQAARALPAPAPPPVAVAPEPPRDPVAEFGHPPPPKEVRIEREREELDEISSTVARTSSDASGRLLLTLANDQVWSLTGWDRPLPPRPDTPVTISKSFLENYLAALPSGMYSAARLR